jgi:hypothetical protein
MEVYDGTEFDELFLGFIGMRAIKHVLENLGMGAQDATMNAKVFSFGSEDNISVLFPWVETVHCDLSDGSWRRHDGPLE